MTQELGETRDAMAMDVVNQAFEIAKSREKDKKPFYIIYSAKVDPALSGSLVNGQKASGGIRQAFRLSYDRPPFVLGMLVWFVNGPLGIFEFVPGLSSPPDMPLNESMLSTKADESYEGLMGKAKEMNKQITLVS